ncbi:MAG: CAP domain-containing protein, partial [Ruminococcus sp.]
SERRKIYITTAVCCLVLAIITAGVLIFLPDTSFRRSMEEAESCYAVASLCEQYPSEAADSRYQIKLLDSVKDIEKRYNEETCGYNQTVQALRQIYSADNPVVRDRTVEVWADVERRRFFQLLNSKRGDKKQKALSWNAELASCAEALADEYSQTGLDYQQNAERIVSGLVQNTEGITLSSLLNTANAQDALVKYEEDSDNSENSDIILGENITDFGADAVYDEKSGMWSFFIVTR